MTAWSVCLFVQSMEKSFEDLLTGLDDDLEPDIDDLFTNYDHLPEVCHLILLIKASRWFMEFLIIVLID